MIEKDYIKNNDFSNLFTEDKYVQKIEWVPITILVIGVCLYFLIGGYMDSHIKNTDYVSQNSISVKKFIK